MRKDNFPKSHCDECGTEITDRIDIKNGLCNPCFSVFYMGSEPD